MRRIAALAVAALLLLLPACGGQEQELEVSAQERVAQAATTTQDQGSAKLALKMTTSGGAQEFGMTGQGAIEFATQRSTLTMSLQGMPGGMGKIEMRTDGPVLYMKMANAKQLGLPTPWLKLRVDEMSGAAAGQFSQFNNTDPARSMEMLRGVADDVEEVGSEDIRGTSTTHYKATIDTKKAIGAAPAKSRKAIEQQFKTAGLKTIPVDVWIDEEGLLRRQVITMDMSKLAKQAGGAGGQMPTEMKIELELFDFGTDVKVAPPPANQVTDFKKLQQQMGG